jgi:hypothetical protein
MQTMDGPSCRRPGSKGDLGLVEYHQASGAVVITTGRFTREAEAFAEGKTLPSIVTSRFVLSASVSNIRFNISSDPCLKGATHNLTPVLVKIIGK